jgi:Tfp pilus assembly protein PilO
MVFLLFLLVFIGIDIKQEILHIFQKQADEKSLSGVLEANKKILIDALQSQQKSVMQVNNSFLETPGILTYFNDIFSAQNIAVNKIQILKMTALGGINVLPVKISAAGQFSAFAKLMFALAEGPRPIVINDFSFQRDSYGAVMAELQLLVLGMNIQVAKVNNQQYERNDENQTSIEKMKWGGFLQDQKTQLGFLILPTGKTIEVYKGMIIGVERGRVIDINENEVSITVAGKIVNISSKLSLPQS